MKSSIKRHIAQIMDLILDEEWELKFIIKPGNVNSLKKFEEINFNKDLIIVFKKGD